jgi:hypothetical protein
MHKTPLLDQLESGPWPSFITDLKRVAGRKKAAADLLGVLERSKDKITHWKHGGIVGVLVTAPIIGRYIDLPEEFPASTFPYSTPTSLRLVYTTALRDLAKSGTSTAAAS